MIDPEILKHADKLADALKKQQNIALSGIEKIPDENMKSQLKSLLQKASSGKHDIGLINKELQNILSNAS